MPSTHSSPAAEIHPRPQQLRVAVTVIAALVLTAAIALGLRRVHLAHDLGALRHDLGSVSLLQIGFGILSIYIGLFLRAVRWALLMSPEQRPSARSLLAPQFVGFAAIALFGRVADLTRPYLVAKKTGNPVTEQIAIYSVERALDLAATATLFSIMLLLVPRSAPHHAVLVRAGIAAFGATAFLLGFALLVRARGDRIALRVRLHGRRAPKLASAIALRILSLQTGFASIRSGAQFAGAFAWSMVIWFGIALSYLFSAHSLRDTPQLTSLHLPSILLLMATSMGASLLQLPILGWFTQVAALAAAYHEIFGVPSAAASLCGAITFTANTLCVIPAGLLFARSSGMSMREAQKAARSEHSTA